MTALMNASELRMGNLVEVEGANARVTAVCDAERMLEAKTREGKLIKTKLHTARPIPITDGRLGELCTLDKDGRLLVGVDKHCYYLRVTDVYVVLLNQMSEPLIHFWDVRYIHQLQNLYYALKGEDMTISW